MDPVAVRIVDTPIDTIRQRDIRQVAGCPEGRATDGTVITELNFSLPVSFQRRREAVVEIVRGPELVAPWRCVPVEPDVYVKNIEAGAVVRAISRVVGSVAEDIQGTSINAAV